MMAADKYAFCDPSDDETWQILPPFFFEEGWMLYFRAEKDRAFQPGNIAFPPVISISGLKCRPQKRDRSGSLRACGSRRRSLSSSMSVPRSSAPKERGNLVCLRTIAKVPDGSAGPLGKEWSTGKPACLVAQRQVAVFCLTCVFLGRVSGGTCLWSAWCRSRRSSSLC
jgi:hypothetical protein